MPRDDTESISNATELLASLGTLALGDNRNRLSALVANRFKSTDASTSTGSVSPFHPDECETYSRALKQVVKTKVMININWCTGRPFTIFHTLLLITFEPARIMSLLGEI